MINEIIREGMEGKHFWTIIKGGESGTYRYVSTSLLPLSEQKIYETMVFKCNRNGTVTRWEELSCDRTTNFDKCVENHSVRLNEIF